MSAIDIRRDRIVPIATPEAHPATPGTHSEHEPWFSRRRSDADGSAITHSDFVDRPIAARDGEYAPRVSVVIPTLNEAMNLPHVFAELPTDLHEVIVVDGFSTDGTVDVARALRPDTTIVHQEGRGKGDALRCGFEAATGDILVMLDADGSADPSEIPAFVNALTSGADFAKGTRFREGGGSSDITRLRRSGNLALNGFVNVLFGTAYSDLCYGYNAFWQHCLGAMAIDCTGFEVETLINIRIARAGLKVHEVPSFERDRIHGDSNLRTFRDGSRVLRTILRERCRRSSHAKRTVPRTDAARGAQS